MERPGLGADGELRGLVTVPVGAKKLAQHAINVHFGPFCPRWANVFVLLPSTVGAGRTLSRPYCLPPREMKPSTPMRRHRDVSMKPTTPLLDEIAPITGVSGLQWSRVPHSGVTVGGRPVACYGCGHRVILRESSLLLTRNDLEAQR